MFFHMKSNHLAKNPWLHQLPQQVFEPPWQLPEPRSGQAKAVLHNEGGYRLVVFCFYVSWKEDLKEICHQNVR